MADCEQKIPAPSIKYDWYQTDANVVITILAKNVAKDGSEVSFDQDYICVSLKLPNDNEHIRKLHLAYPVNTQQCSYRITPTKVEVKLTKLVGNRWETLECQAPKSLVETSEATTSSGPPSYPTSKPGKNWSAIERELKEEEAKEKPVGEEALNKLFQEIYGKGDENVKRAMNKSFIESCGTVLSTNWGEISKDRVDVKPPDDMEFKKWDA